MKFLTSLMLVLGVTLCGCHREEKSPNPDSSGRGVSENSSRNSRRPGNAEGYGQRPKADLGELNSNVEEEDGEQPNE